jgi:hypothetical protein
VKVASDIKANIVAFDSPAPNIYNMLPPPCEDLDKALAISFMGPCKPMAEDFACTPFLVRRNTVIKAFKWLKLNYANYTDLEILYSNAIQYADDMLPVSVEYHPSARKCQRALALMTTCRKTELLKVNLLLQYMV